MAGYDPKEFDVRMREVLFHIGARNYLDIAYCQDCYMPFVISKGIGGRLRTCEKCREMKKRTKKVQSADPEKQGSALQPSADNSVGGENSSWKGSTFQSPVSIHLLE